MIQNKEDYLYYLECDRVALKEKRKKPSLLPGSEVWKYQRLLRKTEYYTNCKRKNPIRLLLKLRLHNLSVKYGFSIPLNAFGPGLSIAHIGTIIINSKSKIGANAVVVKSITEPGTTWGGVPAKKISDHSSERNLVRATELVRRISTAK